MKRLAIISTHPIQYNAPWFSLLAKKAPVKVFYTWEQSQQGAVFDPDFGKTIKWDIPLLEGYEYSFVKNVSVQPGSGHYKGVVNPSLISEIEAWGAEAVLVFGWNLQSHLACLRHFHGRIPVLFRGDSTLLDERPGMKRFARRMLLRWVYRHVDHALYTGTHNKEYFIRHGLRAAQLHFAPHAIDNQRFREPDEQYLSGARAFRQQLGIGAEDRVVLFAGKLEPKKNPEFIIRLAGQVRDPGWTFVLVGNGVLEAGLKARAAGLANVRFLDFQNQRQMPAVYRIGDIFMLPSTGPGETWGLAANEAMASGRAVMLSDRMGGAIDLIRGGDRAGQGGLGAGEDEPGAGQRGEGRNGLIFSPTDMEPCLSMLRRISDDPAMLGRMQQASRDIIREFSFERITSAILELLDRLK